MMVYSSVQGAGSAVDQFWWLILVGILAGGFFLIRSALGMARTLGLDLERLVFLSPSETRARMEPFRSGAEGEAASRLEDADLPAITALLRRRGDATESVVVFTEDEYVGAMILPWASVLSEISMIWEAIGFDLAVSTVDEESGLLLEQDFYDSRGEYRADSIVTVTGWGRLLPE